MSASESSGGEASEGEYVFHDKHPSEKETKKSSKKKEKSKQKKKGEEVTSEGEGEEGNINVELLNDVETGEKKKKDKKKKEAPQQVSIGAIFRYADRYDAFLILFGTLGAMGQGVLFPIFSLVFGALVDAFNYPPDELYDKVVNLCYWFLIIGAAGFGASFFQNSFWSITAERQARAIRKAYLKAIYSQEIGWFDKIGTGELTSRISGDTILVQEGIEKCGAFFQFASQFIAGFVIAFTNGWKLTLVLLAITPLLAASGYMIMKVMASFATAGQTAYAKAGTVATEVISGIRTVCSFGGESRELERYKSNLTTAMNIGIKRASLSGLGFGVMLFCIYGMYALALGYGSVLVINGDYTGGDVLTVLFSVMMGGFALGQAGPSGEALSKGRGAAFKMYETMARVPLIDSTSDTGIKLDKVRGDIKLKKVYFHYPTRPEAKIMKGLNLKIKAGQTTALVGPSGCGKSSTISLIQRFYDPIKGSISLDGTKITDLNTKWLRQNIGLVGQEPVLFSGSIAQNIAYGKPTASREEIEGAARAANAHNFIMDFPDKYDTEVGEKGAQLSGGQKQRIAIARAIIKNPAILLLDEATSALDNESEKIVQEALDSVMKGRTTIIVAHRLSTIRHADHIAVINKGKVAEEGTHDELMAKEGLYHKLVKIQAVGGVEPAKTEKKEKKEKKEDVEKEIAKEIEKIKNSADLTKVHPVSFGRLFLLNKPEYPYVLGGVVSAALNGVVMPIFAIIFSRMVNLYYQPVEDIKRDAKMWAGIFIALGAVPLIFNTLLNVFFGISSERFVRRIREMAFQSLLKQDMAYFDSQSHSTGVLTAHLASEATLVGNLVGLNLAISLQNVFTLIAGLVIAFTYGWKLTLVVLAVSPLMVFGQAVQALTLKSFTHKTQLAYSKANETATESIANMRTVASFTREAAAYDQYSHQLEAPVSLGIKRGLVSGTANAFGVFAIMGVYAISFWYGGKLIKDGEYTFLDVLQVFMAIAMSSMGIGQGAAFAPDATKAKAAASLIFQIIDRKSEIDPSLRGGETTSIKGEIKFENVDFAYPQRPDTKIFDHLSFTVPAGKIIALVGQSGAGKSSVIALLERFYNSSGEGKIYIDDTPIDSFNLKFLRKQISLVGQEPVLFSGSIKDNIMYGKADASEEEVIAAAKASNAHNFIESFPLKYDTQVGEKGAQLSGGQKQRIAIARAIIKDPKILLLDEATSALDTESEKVVQDALDSVMKGRTTVVVAHRLSTIRHADIIAVIEHGKVAEMGTHQELLAKEGAYYRLVGNKK